jgi:hypothetical protein
MPLDSHNLVRIAGVLPAVPRPREADGGLFAISLRFLGCCVAPAGLSPAQQVKTFIIVDAGSSLPVIAGYERRRRRRSI